MKRHSEMQGSKDGNVFTGAGSQQKDDLPQRATAAQLANRKIAAARNMNRSRSHSPIKVPLPQPPTAPTGATGASFASNATSSFGSQNSSFSFGQNNQSSGPAFSFGGGQTGEKTGSMFNFNANAGDTNGIQSNPFSSGSFTANNNSGSQPSTGFSFSSGFAQQPQKSTPSFNFGSNNTTNYFSSSQTGGSVGNTLTKFSSGGTAAGSSPFSFGAASSGTTQASGDDMDMSADDQPIAPVDASVEQKQLEGGFHIRPEPSAEKKVDAPASAQKPAFSFSFNQPGASSTSTTGTGFKPPSTPAKNPFAFNSSSVETPQTEPSKPSNPFGAVSQAQAPGTTVKATAPAPEFKSLPSFSFASDSSKSNASASPSSPTTASGSGLFKFPSTTPAKPSSLANEITPPGSAEKDKSQAKPLFQFATTRTLGEGAKEGEKPSESKDDGAVKDTPAKPLFSFPATQSGDENAKIGTNVGKPNEGAVKGTSAQSLFSSLAAKPASEGAMAGEKSSEAQRNEGEKKSPTKPLFSFPTPKPAAQGADVNAKVGEQQQDKSDKETSQEPAAMKAADRAVGHSQEADGGSTSTPASKPLFTQPTSTSTPVNSTQTPKNLFASALEKKTSTPFTNTQPAIPSTAPSKPSQASSGPSTNLFASALQKSGYADAKANSAIQPSSSVSNPFASSTASLFAKKTEPSGENSKDKFSEPTSTSEAGESLKLFQSSQSSTKVTDPASSSIFSKSKVDSIAEKPTDASSAGPIGESQKTSLFASSTTSPSPATSQIPASTPAFSFAQSTTQESLFKPSSTTTSLFSNTAASESSKLTDSKSLFSNLASSTPAKTDPLSTTSGNTPSLPALNPPADDKSSDKMGNIFSRLLPSEDQNSDMQQHSLMPGTMPGTMPNNISSAMPTALPPTLPDTPLPPRFATINGNRPIAQPISARERMEAAYGGGGRSIGRATHDNSTPAQQSSQINGNTAASSSGASRQNRPSYNLREYFQSDPRNNAWQADFARFDRTCVASESNPPQTKEEWARYKATHRNRLFMELNSCLAAHIVWMRMMTPTDFSNYFKVYMARAAWINNEYPVVRTRDNAPMPESVRPITGKRRREDSEPLEGIDERRGDYIFGRFNENYKRYKYEIDDPRARGNNVTEVSAYPITNADGSIYGNGQGMSIESSASQSGSSVSARESTPVRRASPPRASGHHRQLIPTKSSSTRSPAIGKSVSSSAKMNKSTPSGAKSNSALLGVGNSSTTKPSVSGNSNVFQSAHSPTNNSSTSSYSQPRKAFKASFSVPDYSDSDSDTDMDNDGEKNANNNSLYIQQLNNSSSEQPAAASVQENTQVQPLPPVENAQQPFATEGTVSQHTSPPQTRPLSERIEFPRRNESSQFQSDSLFNRVSLPPPNTQYNPLPPTKSFGHVENPAPKVCLNQSQSVGLFGGGQTSAFQAETNHPQSDSCFGKAADAPANASANSENVKPQSRSLFDRIETPPRQVSGFGANTYGNVPAAGIFPVPSPFVRNANSPPSNSHLVHASASVWPRPSPLRKGILKNDSPQPGAPKKNVMFGAKADLKSDVVFTGNEKAGGEKVGLNSKVVFKGFN